MPHKVSGDKYGERDDGNVQVPFEVGASKEGGEQGKDEHKSYHAELLTHIGGVVVKKPDAQR